MQVYELFGKIDHGSGSLWIGLYHFVGAIDVLFKLIQTGFWFDDWKMAFGLAMFAVD
tara:strand:+ start:597 stop:767 length:171 start_codon:yes stop_codon:yes gene_type:complete